MRGRKSPWATIGGTFNQPMTIWPQHFLESFLSKPAESNSRNNKDELSRLALYLPRETTTRNGCGGYYPFFPPRRSLLLFAPSSETRLLRGEGRGSFGGGKKGEVASGVQCRLILRLSGQLFALLRQLIESAIQMWRDWKRAAPISICVFFLFFPLPPFFPSEQNHSAIRANFIAIFGINRRDRRLPEMGVERRRDRNLSVRQDCRTGRSYLFGLAMKNVQLTLPRFQFNPRRPN